MKWIQWIHTYTILEPPPNHHSQRVIQVKWSGKSQKKWFMVKKTQEKDTQTINTTTFETNFLELWYWSVVMGVVVGNGVVGQELQNLFSSGVGFWSEVFGLLDGLEWFGVISWDWEWNWVQFWCIRRVEWSRKSEWSRSFATLKNACRRIIAKCGLYMIIFLKSKGENKFFLTCGEVVKKWKWNPKSRKCHRFESRRETLFCTWPLSKSWSKITDKKIRKWPFSISCTIKNKWIKTIINMTLCNLLVKINKIKNNN